MGLEPNTYIFTHLQQNLLAGIIITQITHTRHFYPLFFIESGAESGAENIIKTVSDYHHKPQKSTASVFVIFMHHYQSYQGESNIVLSEYPLNSYNIFFW